MTAMRSCQLCETEMEPHLIQGSTRRLWTCQNCGMFHAEKEEAAVTLSFQPREEGRSDSETILSRMKATLSQETTQLRMLHVNCHLGQMLCTAEKRGWKALGVDPRRKAVDLCRSRGLSVFHATAERLPFESSSFHVVYADQVIDRAENAGRALKEWKRVLRTGGLLYLSAVNWESRSASDVSCKDWTAEQRFGFTTKNLGRLAERSGFEFAAPNILGEKRWAGLLDSVVSSFGGGNRRANKNSRGESVLELVMRKPLSSSGEANFSQRNAARAA